MVAVRCLTPPQLTQEVTAGKGHSDFGHSLFEHLLISYGAKSTARTFQS